MAELARSGDSGDLFDQVSALIEQTRAAVATQANAALTLMNWQIGHLIETEVLAGGVPTTIRRLSLRCHDN